MTARLSTRQALDARARPVRDAVAGSTSLSTRLDAEDLGEVIHPHFTLCKARFERHGGFVDREQGDCLRVYFGYPQSHDDGPLEVHIGLHSGEVVAGEVDAHGAGPGPLVVGAVPNVAKRLEEQAAAGQVRIRGCSNPGRWPAGRRARCRRPSRAGAGQPAVGRRRQIICRRLALPQGRTFAHAER